MWPEGGYSGYPQIPMRAKLRLGPWILAGLVIVGLLGASGKIELPDPPTPAQVRATVAKLGTLDVQAVKPKTKHKHRKPNGKGKAKPKAAAPGSVPDVPSAALGHYTATGAGERWRARDGRTYPAWAVLAAIGKIESDHGRSSAPGVRSGVNRFGCCAGPMQFNLHDGPPSTWDRWGRGSVYDQGDAVAAAGRKLRADGARRGLDGAIHSYNHDWGYVARVKALARHYQDRRS
jgi:hypothetical protein